MAFPADSVCGYVAFGLLFFSMYYFHATFAEPSISHQIYDQQYQMHRFVTEYFHGDYGVNDLGLVSFQGRPGAYVLDLAGLASDEAAGEKHKTPALLDGIVSRHKVPLAIVSPTWFSIPNDWTPEARLCLTENDLEQVTGDRCVLFYSTTASGAGAIREELAAFGKTLRPMSGLSWRVQRRWTPSGMTARHAETTQGPGARTHRRVRVFCSRSILVRIELVGAG